MPTAAAANAPPSALLKACYLGDVADVERELAVDVSRCDHVSDFASTPLGAAIAGGRFDVVRLMVEK
jgi:hypothetical protein